MEKRKIYHDPYLPMAKDDMRRKKFEVWQKAGHGERGFCDADACMEGKTTVKRMGVVWLCRKHFEEMTIL